MNTPRLEAAIRSFDPLLVVVEGVYDIAFLKHVSKVLHHADAAIPDLNSLEAEGRVAVVALGGGGCFSWSHRFAGLNLREFHLYDREVDPETDNRLAAAIATNCRPDCRALLTNRRGMENYLDVHLVGETLGVDVEFGAEDDVSAVIARRIFESGHPTMSWNCLLPGAKKRLRERAKRLLNTRVIARMSVEHLERCGGAKDFRCWLQAIAEWAA